MAQVDTFTEYRPLLFSIAYRMLGGVMDAEDVVQETYLRWENAGEIESPKAFLSTITTRLCIDQPLYLSIHSGVGDLAPAGGAMIHVAKYLGNDRSDTKDVERELEGLLDLAQPGWRDVLVERRFLPDLTVVNALATAENGALSGRPGPVTDIPGVYLAGDWVGGVGWLADASLASAKRAASAALESLPAGP